MLSCCFQEMGSCLPQTRSTIANVPHFQPQMKSNKDIDVFANKSSELSNMTFPGDESESEELGCLQLEVLWRKSGGLFTSLSAGMSHCIALKAIYSYPLKMFWGYRQNQVEGGR